MQISSDIYKQHIYTRKTFFWYEWPIVHDLSSNSKEALIKGEEELVIRIYGGEWMGYETSCGSSGLSFDLNFIMSFLGSIDEVEASVCTSGSIKNKYMYVECNEMGVGVSMVMVNSTIGSMG